MKKLLKELRISFIILNREKYERVYLPAIEDNSINMNSIVSDMLRSLIGIDAAYRDHQDCYFNSLEYGAWVAMKKDHVSEVLGRLRNDRIVQSDDIDFFKQYFLFFSSVEYFQKSWYCLPSLEFSNEFYKNVLPNYFQCLLNHESGPARYQYQLEEIALNDPTAKLQENSGMQRYFLLNERLIDDLLIEMRDASPETLPEAVASEWRLMFDALQRSKDEKAYIIITSF